MKSLKEFILENVEILKDRLGDGYRTIVLAKRTDVDCEHISKEEFCKLIEEDYQKAVKEATELLDKEYEDTKEERLARVRAEAEKYAAKYKQKARAKKYIDNAIANETSKKRRDWNDVKWFDFDPNFGKENYCVVISDKEDVRKRVFERIYDELTQDDYKYSFFKEATGWAFKYTCDDKTFENRYRPWVDLIVSDTKQEEIKQNKERLADAINKFYANSNYWGD